MKKYNRSLCSFQYTLKSLTLLSLFSLACLTVKGQDKVTLQQAVENVIQNNLQIKQAQLNESLSEQNLRESKLALLPTLNSNSNLNFNFGRSVDPFSYQFVNQQITSINGSVFSGLTLFQGGQKINQIAQNKYLLEADKSNTKKVRNDLVLSVVTTYLTVLNNRDLLSAAKQQLDISRQQLDREQKQFDVGNKTLADLSQAKSQVATAEFNVTDAQNQLDISYLSLAQLMERDPAQEFEVVAPLVDEVGQVNSAYSAAEVFTKAVQNYPDIKLAEYERLAADKAVKVARGSLYPRLEFQGSLGSGYSSNRQRVLQSVPTGVNNPIGFVEGTNQRVLTPGFNTVTEITPFRSQLNENFNQTIGFSLSIPIFNGLSSRIAVSRAKIRYQNAQIAEQLAKNNLNKVISQAVLDLKAAEKRYYSAQSAFESSQSAFRVIEQRYNVGLVNSLDFNQSQTNLNQAQFKLIQAKYDLIFRSKVIDFYLGNPLTF
ncbi:TolC family protein [Rubrolithibacter danxiaensis]|uniref:TolC family protein n=1 Tax=Rubrolithibacter danxiaensis TaxID=3390805 RepID=UPI003BF8472D